MNFKNRTLLNALMLAVFFSITTSVQSETNALGQQITVIGQEENDIDIQTSNKDSI